jgi:hypothetical protein
MAAIVSSRAKRPSTEIASEVKNWSLPAAGGGIEIDSGSAESR